MESTDKFSNSKEVIAFLAETFPQCFSLQGDAKPLKIGIFQDLAGRLEEETRVSKTLLRSSLRHYTNSWRYLYSIKEGAARVDLDGNESAIIEKEHADHAAQQLKDSKEKAAQKRKENVDKESKSDSRPKKKRVNVPSRGTKRTENHSKRPVPAKLETSDLKPGTNVTVKLGKVPMHAVITEIAKDGVHVQLNSGMAMKVDSDSLRLAPSKR
jgi:ProP effector